MDNKKDVVKYPKKFTVKNPFTFKGKKYKKDGKFEAVSKEQFDILSNKNLI